MYIKKGFDVMNETEEFIEQNAEENEKKIEYVKTSYLNEIEKIERLEISPDEKIKLIDLLARDFLVKKFHIKRNLEYGEIIQFFLEKNKPKIATFCHNMVIFLYSGEEIRQDNIIIILEDLRSIIAKEQEQKIKNDGPSFKSVFNPIIKTFQIFRKKSKKENEEFVGQKTKKIIENEIIKKSHSKKIEEARKKLNVNDEEEIMNGSQEDGPIESIDNLERIRHKITNKKREIYERLSNVPNN